MGSAEGHLNMASAVETSNAFCSNNVCIVPAAKLRRNPEVCLKGRLCQSIIYLAAQTRDASNSGTFIGVLALIPLKQWTKIISDKTLLF